jgi:hypothetical protein
VEHKKHFGFNNYLERDHKGLYIIGDGRGIISWKG